MSRFLLTDAQLQALERQHAVPIARSRELLALIGVVPESGGVAPNAPPVARRRRKLHADGEKLHALPICPDPFVLDVPLPQSLTNASGKSRNFWTVNAAKKRYWVALDERAIARLIPPPRVPPIRDATVSAVMRVGGRMDDDNAIARAKWILDWLATRGYVVNDRYLRWLAPPQQIVKRDGDYRLVITLTPIDP